jgi:uncharacterized membrane protein
MVCVVFSVLWFVVCGSLKIHGLVGGIREVIRREQSEGMSDEPQIRMNEANKILFCQQLLENGIFSRDILRGEFS